MEIALPLAEQSFLEVPRLDVTHTSLLMILLTEDVELKAAVFHRPTMLVTQDSSGQWNVSEAIELITRAAGKNQAANEPAKPMPLPAVTVEDGTLKLIDRNGRTAAVQSLQVTGAPNGPLVWKYDVCAEDRVRLTGQVAPGGAWEHDLAFAVGDVSPWVSPWLSSAASFRTAGSWHGEMDGANVEGRLTFDQLSVGTLNMQGAAAVRRDGSGAVTVSPIALILQIAGTTPQKITATSGDIVVGATSATAKDLALSINGGQTRLNGSYSWADQSANIDAIWHDIAFPQGTTHQGSASAKLTMPWPGALRIDADVHSSGTTSAGAWDAHVLLSGAGRAWNDIDWNATLARAAWSGARSGSISDVKAVVLTRADKITLQSISGTVAGAALTGNGAFDLTDRTWQLTIDGNNIAVPKAMIAPASFRLRAAGDQRLATLQDLSVNSGDIEVHGNGSYDSKKPRPVSLQLVLSHFPTLQGGDANAFVRGRIYGKASLSGTLSPVDLNIDEGSLYGSEVALGNRTIGELAVQLAGQVTANQARIKTTEATVLGGKWRVSAEWPEADFGTELQVGVRELPLKEIGAFFKRPDLSGSLTGAWTIDIPSADRSRITASGSVDMRDVIASAFSAERITAQAKLRDGELAIAPIHIEQQGGVADVNLNIPLQQAVRCRISANVTNWPTTAPSGQASARVSAQTQLAVDLKNKSAVGPFNAQVAFNVNSQDAGTLSLESSIDGRVVKISQLRAAALGGTAQGDGVLVADALAKSAANLSFANIDASQVAAFIPNGNGLTGQLSGSAHLAPIDNSRSLGASIITARVLPKDFRYKSLDIGSIDIESYFDGTRFVLNNSTVHVAGGEIRLWARSTPHADDVRSSQIQIDFHHLDINELDQAFDANPKPMPGKLDGSFVVIGSMNDRDSLFGQGSVSVYESNLANLGAIRGLYNLMHLGQPDGNTGAGGFNVRLDHNIVSLENARYFNRGVEVRAAAMIHNVWHLPDSPLEGTLIGSLRPLKDIKLPFFADADHVMNALQQNVTTVKVMGTARKYDVVPSSFNEVGDTMRGLLLGEVQNNK